MRPRDVHRRHAAVASGAHEWHRAVLCGGAPLIGPPNQHALVGVVPSTTSQIVALPSAGALDYNPCLHEPTRVQMTYHTLHVADARHIFMGRTSAPWAPLRYAPRRQPTHPPSSEPAGAQGVLGRFGTWYLRVFPVVASTIPQFRARPALVRCLSRL